MQTTDIAVVGGGLIGRLLAWRLAQTGRSVALYEAGDRDGQGSAAYVAAAMLAPLAEAVDAGAQVCTLGRQSLVLWPQWLAQWPLPVFWQQQGSVVVWHGGDRALAQGFVQAVQRIHGKDCGQLWDAAALAAAEPQLAGRFDSAWWLPSEGQLDNRQVLRAAAAAAEAAGVRCYWQTAVGGADWPAADWTVDCRGHAGGDDWNRQAGSRLRGVRGEVARVYAPEVRLNRPLRLLHPRYPLYIAPKPQQLFVVGATQLESESRAPVSVRSGLELLSALYTVHPAFGEAEIRELNVGLRPTLPHHEPEIRHCVRRRYLAVNGLYRHGFLIGPALVEAVLRLLGALDHGQTPLHDALSGLIYHPLNKEQDS